MVQAELYQNTPGKSCPLTVVINPRMFAGLRNASGTFQHEDPLAGRKELAGGQETALCLRYLIVTIFCSLLSAETT